MPFSSTWYDDTWQLPCLSVSKDHGMTWGTPRMIAPPGVKATTFPSTDAGSPGASRHQALPTATCTKPDSCSTRRVGGISAASGEHGTGPVLSQHEARCRRRGAPPLPS